MTDVIIVIGAANGIDLEFTKLALQSSASPVLAIDARLSDNFLALEERHLTRLTKVVTQVDSRLDWNEILQPVVSVRSVVFLLPPCRSRDTSVNNLGYSEAFSENISDSNVTLLNLVRTVQQRLIDDSNLVLVSSVLSERIAVDDASLDYHAAKSVLETIMRFLAVKLSPKTVVNCIAPALIARDNDSVLLADEELRSRVERAVSLRRPSRQIEIAKCIWSLSSGSLPYITGQTIIMDGGSSVLAPFCISK